MKKHFKELIRLINWPAFFKLWGAVTLIIIAGYLISLSNGKNVFPHGMYGVIFGVVGSFIVFFGHSVTQYMEHLMRLKHKENKKQQLNK